MFHRYCIDPLRTVLFPSHRPGAMLAVLGLALLLGCGQNNPTDPRERFPDGSLLVVMARSSREESRWNLVCNRVWHDESGTYVAENFRATREQVSRYDQFRIPYSSSANTALLLRETSVQDSTSRWQVTVTLERPDGSREALPDRGFAPGEHQYVLLSLGDPGFPILDGTTVTVKSDSAVAPDCDAYSTLRILASTYAAEERFGDLTGLVQRTIQRVRPWEELEDSFSVPRLAQVGVSYQSETRPTGIRLFLDGEPREFSNCNLIPIGVCGMELMLESCSLRLDRP